MASLLKHMVDMTGHRDHAMLDISVISAVNELAGAIRTRILSIHPVAGHPYLRARAIVDQGSPARLEEFHDTLPGEPLAAHPELAHCLTEQHTSVETVHADGSRILWFPIWFGDKASTCLEIHKVGRVTVSVGFVSISAFEAPVMTLGHADQALYHAKSRGRNQACHYDDLVSHGVLQAVASNDTAEFF